MKTGAVAKRFGLDPNTVADWTDRFTEFFSSEARSVNRKQRDYQPEDLVVLNTIRGHRAKNTDWEEIRGYLATGERDANLPPDFVSIDGENAITVYAEMREMRVKLETAEAEVKRLREESQKLRDEYRIFQQQHNAEMERLMKEKENEAVKREGELREQIGELKAMLRIYKERDNDE